MTAAEPGGTKTYARARNRAAERRRRREEKMLANDKFMAAHIRPSFPGVNAFIPARMPMLMVLPPRWHSRGSVN
jgi:hypothetical protein